MANGKPPQLAWSVAGSEVGFLALDRNGNGTIDNGAELFTGISPQGAVARPSSRSAGAATVSLQSDFKTAALARGAGQRAPTATTRKNGFTTLAFFDQPANAQEQGNSYFWALHDFMFDQQKDLNRDNLLGKLADVTRGLAGFDQGKFAVCVMERKTAAQVDEAVAFAQQNGINATPVAFINGQKTQVVAPEQIRTLIRQLSEGAKPASPAADPAPAKQDR